MKIAVTMLAFALATALFGWATGTNQNHESARGEFDLLPKQEAAGKLAELERLERTLGGMRDMSQLPAAVFIIDPKREHLAVHEARRLGIPVIAVTDTNCDPDDADFLIPANDDAIRAVRLLAAGIADAAIEGQTRYEIAQADQEMAPASRASDFADLFAATDDLTNAEELGAEAVAVEQG